MSPPRAVSVDEITDDRPRLLATGTSFDRAAESISTDEFAESWYDNVETHADRLFDETLVPDDVPENLGSVRRTTGRLWRLAFMYRHTGESRYAERAWDALGELSDLDDWHPEAFLRTGELAAGVATAYDWCFEHFSPDRRDRIRAALVENVLEEAVRGYRLSAEGADLDDFTWWIECDHNWNTVCNGGVAMAALAVAGAPDLDDIVEETLAGARRSVKRALDAIGSDGGWGEGPVYWGYMSRYLSFYLISLENALGAVPEDLSPLRLAETGYFPIYTLSGEKTFNFGDAGPIKLNTPQLFWLAERYDRPVFAGYQHEMLGRGQPIGEPYREETGNTGGANDWGVLDLLWYRPGQGAPVSELPLDRVFGDVGVATFRESWAPGSRFVGVKGGDNAVNHSHLDLGSFVFDALGTRWACDLGGDDYDLEGYFEDGRWQYYRLRTEGHNTLLIDPDRAPNQSPEATASIVDHGSGPGTAYAVVDLSAAYPEQALSVYRGVALLDDRSSLLVRDEVQTSEPVDLWWFMHTEASIRTDESGATLSRDGAELPVDVPEASDGDLSAMAAAPLPASPDPDAQADNEDYGKLAIHRERVSDPTITALLGPIEGDRDASWASREVPAIGEWSVGALET